MISKIFDACRTQGARKALVDAMGKLANFTKNQPALPAIVFTEIQDPQIAMRFDIPFSPFLKMTSELHLT